MELASIRAACPKKRATRPAIWATLSMLCIESVLAQTHTPEESIGYEMLYLNLMCITISKLTPRNNPHSGDFL
jgi:hypothetical protein